MQERKSFTVFCGERKIAGGELEQVLDEARAWAAERGEAGLLYFDDQTGRQVDFDLRSTPLEAPAKVGPGRPKLGVISREVSLLPRHWEWLEEQPNGASAALRRLIDQARNQPGDRERRARHAAGLFLTAMAGNLPGYEESTRALYAGDLTRFSELIAGWPADIREHAVRLAQTI